MAKKSKPPKKLPAAAPAAPPGAMARLDAAGPASAPRVAKPIAIGVLAILVFFGGFIGWAAQAPLSSAAVASGQVGLDTNRKLVQHLEGGIVRRLAVRESQRVKAGDILIELDTTKAQANMILLRARLVSANAQMRLLTEEISGVERLFKRGLAHKPRLLSLKRRRAELLGQVHQDLARLAAAEDVMRRSKIRAPISGIVVGLKVHTRGGVIAPGAELMAIVPDDERLVIEARIEPNDIDVVRPGLKAQVRITPYNARLMPPIPGTVRTVSADRFTDQRTGQSYYLARIELTPPSAHRSKLLRLRPGMPVEVMIVTGERTLLDYLIDPILKSINRAGREG